MVQLWAKKARFLISLLKTNGWSIFKCKNGWSMAHVNWRSAKSKVHGTAGQREKCWCLHQIAKTEQEQRVSSWERETESWLRAEIAGHVLKALQVNCVDQQRWKAGCWAEGLMLTLGKPLPLSGEVEEVRVPLVPKWKKMAGRKDRVWQSTREPAVCNSCTHSIVFPKSVWGSWRRNSLLII